MKYYILLPGDSELDCLAEANLLGEISFDSFYSSQGIIVLSKLLAGYPELLEHITIKDQQGGVHTLEQFLTMLNNHKLY